MEHMTYEKAMEYIHGLYWRGKKNGLEKTRELLLLCGNPEKELRYIHIAGTNGKGSTAAMLSNILEKAGYRTGLYTSPYIVRYNERISVNHADIADEELAGLTEELAACVEKMEEPPSEFEFGTVLALLYFKRLSCDVVVLEAGLGGEFDSTNVIPAPVVSVITALGYDHTAILGKTMTEIATAKAGIIKPGSRVVFYGEEPEGEAVIRKRCEVCGNSLVLPDFTALSSEEASETVEEALKRGVLPKQRFSYRNRKHLNLSLSGLYQKKNAALVLETIDQLRMSGFEITEEAVRTGLSTVFWQARLEVVSYPPLLLVDGSHNPQGMQATMEGLEEMFPDRRFVFVFGAMADKELDRMIPLFLPKAKRVYVTAPSMPRAMRAEELMKLCIHLAQEQKCVSDFICCPEVYGALTRVQKEADDEIVVIIGSLYLAGEVKNLLSGA